MHTGLPDGENVNTVHSTYKSEKNNVHTGTRIRIMSTSDSLCESGTTYKRKDEQAKTPERREIYVIRNTETGAKPMSTSTCRASNGVGSEYE